MKAFVTGACGQLGHDVVNELVSRGHEAVASDIQLVYSGINAGSNVTVTPYTTAGYNRQNSCVPDY